MCRETIRLVDLHSLKVSCEFGLLLKPFWLKINKVLQKFNSCFDLPMYYDRSIIFTLNAACLVFLGIAFSFMKLTSSSETLTKCEAAILKDCPPAIITSLEVIIVEYDVILGQ